MPTRMRYMPLAGNVEPAQPFVLIHAVKAAITVVFPTPPLPPWVNSICDRFVIVNFWVRSESLVLGYNRTSCLFSVG